MTSRQMLLIPADAPITVVDAPTLTDMANLIGAEYVERVHIADAISLAVDEDGHAKALPINPRASMLYGVTRHGVPIVGDALLAAEALVDDGTDWVDTDPARLIAFVLTRLPALDPESVRS